jgi:hypothetical protein
MTYELKGHHLLARIYDPHKVLPLLQCIIYAPVKPNRPPNHKRFVFAQRKHILDNT